MTSNIQTRSVMGRRLVTLPDIPAFLAEIDRLTQAARAGPVRTLGNWNLGQIFDHLANLIEYSRDGFPFTAPPPLRWVGCTIKCLGFEWMVRKLLMRPGLKLPRKARMLEPTAAADLDLAAARLRGMLNAIHQGQPLTQPSPILGRLSHDQWVYLHLRHAEMHLSFVVI